ncbi:MAG: ATP-binding protein [Elusimicrobia bacterium]|nr:ATP-binding protein [Elusimicrobiota bacterium]
MIKRSISKAALRILREYNKMAFLAGPRQCGKTTLARRLGQEFSSSVYFNWDILTDQKKLLKNPYFYEETTRESKKNPLVIFDEIHKYGRWKNYLKGVYDKDRDDFYFLVTGSGRLDLFQRGGDSLLGRYLALPLMPLTLGEVLNGSPVPWKQFKNSLQDVPESSPRSRGLYRGLWSWGGFPEPFLKGEEQFYQAWMVHRKTLLLREDIRQMTNIRDLSLLEMLSHLLPQRVGSPLSINALREDMGVAFETVRDWLEILARFYYIFRLTPFAGSLARALRKETKTYLYDWPEITDEGARFENLVALHLWKAAQTCKAIGEADVSVHYLRDKEKREVDFVLCERRQPVLLIETKLSDQTPSASLLYYQERLNIPVGIQLVHQEGVCKKMTRAKRATWVISASRWLALLG